MAQWQRLTSLFLVADSHARIFCFLWKYLMWTIVEQKLTVTNISISLKQVSFDFTETLWNELYQPNEYTYFFPTGDKSCDNAHCIYVSTRVTNNLGKRVRHPIALGFCCVTFFIKITQKYLLWKRIVGVVGKMTKNRLIQAVGWFVHWLFSNAGR